MSRTPGIVASSTPVYVEAVLEDGRIMIIPAQAIPTSSVPQQNGQPIQIQNAVVSQVQSTNISVPVTSAVSTQLSRSFHVREQQNNPNSIQLQPLDRQCTSNRASVQVSRHQEAPKQEDLYGTLSNQHVPSNIDITNIVQSIHIEPSNEKGPQGEDQSLHRTTCMMNCGNDRNSKGSARLVTDDRCGHIVCLNCLMKSPNCCPICDNGHDHVLNRNSVITNKKEQNECSTCGKTFKRPSDLLRHRRICHGDNDGAFSCPVCNKKFTRAFDLKRHTITHNTEKKYECGKCGAKFNRTENMKRHLQAHSGEKPFQCPECKKEFGQQENLNRHILSHTGDFQRYKCNKCDKDFTRLASLRRHEHRHNGDWPYTCHDCDPPRGFSEPGLFRKHRLTHKGIKPYVCNACNKGFNNPKAYRNHRRIHTGERPYVCKVCEVAFSQWGHLKRHKKVHEKQDAKAAGCYIRRPQGYPRRQADPYKPKLPLSAYFLWFMDARERILKANPHLNMPELAKAGGRLWKTINQEERKFYEKKAISERERYRKQLEEYTRKRRQTFKPANVNGVLSKSDMCVGTDTEFDPNSKETHSSPLVAPENQGKTNSSGGFDGNLLESAGRSVGLLPDAYSGEVVQLDSANTFNHFHSTSSTFSRVPARTYQDFSESRHSVTDAAMPARTVPTNVTLTTLSSNSHGPRPSVSHEAHSGMTAPHFNTFNRYQSGEDFVVADYPFTNSPTHILDFSNRVEGSAAEAT
ncbi:zinc finger protein 773-like [Bolinopsis microptera]|uniref:zinc finger protein 773-like n=1 Tax=Bolinopsis microptera TaxID=2820187 RepID=UPI0030798624